MQTKTSHLFSRHDRNFSDLLSCRRLIDVCINKHHLTIRQYQGIHRRISIYTRTTAEYLVNVMQMQINGTEGAANHAVCITFMNRHGTNQRMTTTHL